MNVFEEISQLKAEVASIQEKVQANSEKMVIALASSDKASAKADAAMEKRFDSVNEFRQTLSDQTQTFLPRAEYTARHSALIDKVDDLKAAIFKIEGKSSGLSAGWGYLVGIFGLIATIVAVIIALRKW